MDERYARLLLTRIPLHDIILGRAYVIHARNGGVGVAQDEGGRVGYRLRREKFDKHFLFVEDDWHYGVYGTAIPLLLLQEQPPTEDELLLTWLATKQDENAATIKNAWDIVLGRPVLSKK